MEDRIILTVGEDSADRLDQFIIATLASRDDFSGVTRSQVKNWIETGNVSINDKVASKAGTKIRIGEIISILSQPPQSFTPTPWDFPLNIVYEDEDLVVIDKPASLTVHPGAGNKDKTLVNALVHRYGLKNLPDNKSFRPGIIHRIDKDTTGLLVVARNIESQSLLAKQFSTRTVNRNYKALIRSLPRSLADVDTKEGGRIETLIGRHPTQRTMMAVLSDTGRTAITNWKILERFHYGALVDIKLETGRTHQIRVHMNHIKAPVIGDLVYGDFKMLPTDLLRAANKFGRQALHAYRLGFSHPRTDKELEFQSPLPKEFEELISVFRNYG